MLILSYGLILVATLIMSWLGSRWLASHSNPFRIMDRPNDRSLHDEPKPRAGGIAILLAIAIGWAWVSYIQELPDIVANIAVPLLCVAGISLLDDQKGVSPKIRLLVHGASSAWLVLMLSEQWFFMLLAWLVIVWIINLYNFMDGIDGMAGAMALIGFCAFGIIAWLNGHQIFAIFAWVVAAASAGFLLLNWPPARIFMGDVGSVSLGFLVSIFWIWGVVEDVFAVWMPVLIFSPFFIDATVTLLQRIFRGEHIFEAHRSHYYQRLVQLGWGHSKTVILELLLMLTCSASAIILNILNLALVSFVVVGMLFLLYYVIALKISCYEGQ